jgi:hypothetical protein
MLLFLLALCSVAYATKFLDRNLAYRSPFHDLPEVSTSPRQPNLRFTNTELLHSFPGIRAQYTLVLSDMQRDNLGKQQIFAMSITQPSMGATSAMCVQTLESIPPRS